jgi:hypothetical protein
MTTITPLHHIRVALERNPYEVVIGAGGLARLGQQMLDAWSAGWSACAGGQQSGCRQPLWRRLPEQPQRGRFQRGAVGD